MLCFGFQKTTPVLLRKKLHGSTVRLLGNCNSCDKYFLLKTNLRRLFDKISCLIKPPLILRIKVIISIVVNLYITV